MNCPDIPSHCELCDQPPPVRIDCGMIWVCPDCRRDIADPHLILDHIPHGEGVL